MWVSFTLAITVPKIVLPPTASEVAQLVVRDENAWRTSKRRSPENPDSVNSSIRSDSGAYLMGWLTGDCEAEDEVCEASARTVREETDREIINQPSERPISLPANGTAAAAEF